MSTMPILALYNTLILFFSICVVYYESYTFKNYIFILIIWVGSNAVEDLKKLTISICLHVSIVLTNTGSKLLK
jgi:hypothetical protein